MTSHRLCKSQAGDAEALEAAPQTQAVVSGGMVPHFEVKKKIERSQAGKIMKTILCI